MKRICVNVTEEQAARLKERAELTGVLQSEIIRRAVWHELDQPVPLAFSPENQRRKTQPVLFVANPNKETR